MTINVLPILILFLVLIAIAIRKSLPWHPRIWVLMLLGALAVMVLGAISLPAAWNAVDFDIIGFLLGAFIMGEALDESGLINQLCQTLFKYGSHKAIFLLILMITTGITSALLTNDTIAIIATPLLIRIAASNNCAAKPYLLATAFAITIGSVMSPTGNPQNLLIAIQGHLTKPFTDFFIHLAPPTLLNLLIAWLFIIVRYRAIIFDQSGITIKSSTDNTCKISQTLCYISLIIFIILIALKVLLLNNNTLFNLPLSLISLLAAMPIVIGSRQRLTIIKRIDWGTLIFFAAMFILMQSVWNSGLLQTVLHDYKGNLSDPAAIFTVSIVMSQLISNVPFVALYLPLLMHLKANVATLMTLAAGSTIAGNFLPIGAASNMIILQQADKQRDPGFSVVEFVTLGVPLGCVNALVYYWWLH